MRSHTPQGCHRQEEATVEDAGRYRAGRAVAGIGPALATHRPIYRMLLLTGQRKSEVAGARWREFDLEKRLCTIPASRMKMDAAHVVPLTDEVIALLQSLPRFKKGDHLFTTTYRREIHQRL